MKFIVNRATFLDAMLMANSVIPSRTPKPALSCVLIETGDGPVKVSATDLERRIRTVVNQVQIEQSGSVLVNAEKLLGIVRTQSDDTLTVSLEGDMLHIRTADSHYKLYTEQPTQFPPDWVDGDEVVKVALPSTTLTTLLSRTVTHAAHESTRYAFNAVLMLVGSDGLRCVATDGRRLAMATNANATSDKPISVLVPTGAIKTLLAMDMDPEETVTLTADGNRATFATDHVRLTTVLTEGQFPPYGDVIPKGCDRTAVIGRVDLESALRRANLMVVEESKGVRMEFGKDSLVIKSRSPSEGEATVTVPCRFDHAGNGDEYAIGFNPDFLLDALKGMDGDDVVIEMTAPNRPGVLKSGADYTTVIMPVNLN